jgi:hypothetical protein
MANTDSPYGFTPVRHLTGGTLRMSEYKIADGYATSIFNGDVVTMANTGYINVGTTSTPFIGVFAGCSYTTAAGEKVFSKHWPASTDTNGDAIAYVHDDPMTVFAVQHDGNGAFADNGAGFDLTATAGSTTNGRSKQELSTSSKADVGQFKQLGLLERSNNAWSASSVVEVVITQHQNTPGPAYQAES